MKGIKYRADRLLSLGLSIAGVVAVAGLFHTSFSLPGCTIIVLTAVLSCCVFFFLLTVFAGRKRRFILFCFLCFWIVCGFVFREQIAYGAIVFSRVLAPYFMKAMHYELATFRPLAANAETLYLWFGVYALAPYTLWMTWTIAVRRNTPVALLLTVPPFVFAYMLADTPPDIFMAILFVFWAALLLQARLPKPEKKGATKSRVMCIALCAAVFLTVFAAFPQESYTPSPTTIAFREQLKEAAANISYTFTGGSGGPIGNRGGSTDLNATGSTVLADSTVLSVYASDPQDIYLRGYAASEYTGHEWLQADAASFEGSGIGIQPMAYLEENGADYFSGKRSQISIEPKRTDSPWMFTPYRFAQMQNTAAQPRWIGDSHLPFAGEYIYTYETYGDAEQTIVISGGDHSVPEWLTSAMHENGNRRRGSISFEGYDIGFISTAAGLLLNESGDIPNEVSERAEEYFYDPPTNVDTLSLFYPQENTDAGYLRYIADEYTQLPDGVREMLLTWWEEQSGNASNGNAPYYNWAGLAGQVAEVVRNSGTYTTTPGQQPQNRDFVEYFLMESNKGYCVHFASATTVALRALGVPARYVEGYVVRQGDFDGNGQAQVSAKTAHAWAEIWIPDLGWTPVESTPGGDAVPQIWTAYTEEGRDSGNEAEMQDEIPEQQTEEPATPTENPEQVPSSVVERNAILFAMETDIPTPTGRDDITLLPYVIAVIGGMLLLIPVCRRIKRVRSFRQPDHCRAVLFMYDYLCELSAYGQDIVSQAAVGIAREARFGAQPVPAGKVRFMENETQEKRRQILSALKWWKRLLLLWKGL